MAVDRQDSHFTGGAAKTQGGAPREEAAPPLPMHHRVKLGHFDAAATNPNGVGMPSTENKIANDQRKTW
jgi:hypothetical protein